MNHTDQLLVAERLYVLYVYILNGCSETGSSQASSRSKRGKGIEIMKSQNHSNWGIYIAQLSAGEIHKASQ